MAIGRRFFSIVPALLALAPLSAVPAGCRRVETAPQPNRGNLAIVYSANVMGEIDPCG